MPRLPNLVRLGLAEAAGIEGLAAQAEDRVGASGRAALGYAGADTYMGHQELMGLSLGFVRQHMLAEIRSGVWDALTRAGHELRDAHPSASAIVVDGRVVIADNIEAAPGLNINVTGSLDEISFDDLLQLGETVRRLAALPRVIVVGGKGFRGPDIVASLRERAPGHLGVDTPGLGVYDEHYQVRHLGAATTAGGSLPELVARSGREVVLLGKAADVVDCDGATRENHIPTSAVLSRALELITPSFRGLVVANVQETDLAGHEQAPERFRHVLEEVDDALPALMMAAGRSGALFVTADHGNDPCVGHSQHTREFTPVLAAGGSARPSRLGTRESLSDPAATAAKLLGLPSTVQGKSFATEVWPAA